MSTSATIPLGGFEERLLTQLKAQVASRPSPPVPPAPLVVPVVGGRGRGALALLGGLAAAAATVLLILSVLLGSQPALVQAFPLLGGRSHGLSALVKRLLRTQRIASSNSWLADGRAYAFRTRAGAGYVVVDEPSDVVCIVVPVIGGRCETASQVLAEGSAGIVFVAEPQPHEEAVVDLVRAGANATVMKESGADLLVTRRDAILSVVSRRPVTITTTFRGRTSSSTYDPGAAFSAIPVSARPGFRTCSPNSRPAPGCERVSVSASMNASTAALRRPGGTCAPGQNRLRSTEASGDPSRSSTSPPPEPAALAGCTSH